MPDESRALERYFEHSISIFSKNYDSFESSTFDYSESYSTQKPEQTMYMYTDDKAMDEQQWCVISSAC